jgi:hypothetical protein
VAGKRGPRGAKGRPEKTIAQRRADHMRAAVKYYSKEQWTPERLVRKAGRLATRIVAANQVLKETDGLVLLGPSVESALRQLIHSDQHVQ